MIFIQRQTAPPCVLTSSIAGMASVAGKDSHLLTLSPKYFMKLHLDSSNGYRIHHYDQHSVTINNVVYTQSLIVMPEYLSEWGVENFNTLQVDDFKRLVALSPELILLGTGLQLRFPVTSLLVPLINQSIGLEVMGLHAACRTYNILMGEGRKVAAALLFK